MQQQPEQPEQQQQLTLALDRQRRRQQPQQQQQAERLFHGLRNKNLNLKFYAALAPHWAATATASAATAVRRICVCDNHLSCGRPCCLPIACQNVKRRCRPSRDVCEKYLWGDSDYDSAPAGRLAHTAQPFHSPYTLLSPSLSLSSTFPSRFYLYVKNVRKQQQRKKLLWKRVKWLALTLRRCWSAQRLCAVIALISSDRRSAPKRSPLGLQLLLLLLLDCRLSLSLSLSTSTSVRVCPPSICLPKSTTNWASVCWCIYMCVCICMCVLVCGSSL